MRPLPRAAGACRRKAAGTEPGSRHRRPPEQRHRGQPAAAGPPPAETARRSALVETARNPAPVGSAAAVLAPGTRSKPPRPTTRAARSKAPTRRIGGRCEQREVGLGGSFHCYLRLGDRANRLSAAKMPFAAWRAQGSLMLRLRLNLGGENVYP